jgi:hypothetical protein
MRRSNDPRSDAGRTLTLPRITIPPVERATPQELERRRRLYADTLALRAKIGPIDIAADDLVHLGRGETSE